MKAVLFVLGILEPILPCFQAQSVTDKLRCHFELSLSGLLALLLLLGCLHSDNSRA